MEKSGEHRKLIIYIPALNEAATIQQIINDLPSTIKGIDEIMVLVVDDGSTDNTADLAREAHATVLRHPKNLGLGIAFRTAIKYALSTNAHFLVSIDADGQFNPANIPDMMPPLISDQAVMVTGNRFQNGIPQNMPALKYYGNKLFSWVLNTLTKNHFQDVSCGFRAYSREALYHLNLFGTYSYTHEVVLNLAFKGFSITEIPIQVKYFPGRKSRVASSIPKYAFNMGKIITRTMLDYKPIYFFGNLGILNILIGIIFVGFMLVHYFQTEAFTPYKSYGFIGLGFALVGLFILFIGLVADMLNRIRLNQDKILYFLQVKHYQDSQNSESNFDENS